MSWTPDLMPEHLLSQAERQVIERGGYGAACTPGSSPCLLLVDMQLFLIGVDKPILEQIDERPSAIGIAAWEATRHIQPLLAEFRSRGLPIIHVNVSVGAKGDAKSGLYGRRISRSKSQLATSELSIIDEVAPLANEMVIQKRFSSAFVGNSLGAVLSAMDVDSLVIVGGSTSGCIRATAVDAVNYGLMPIIVDDCIFDRMQVSHFASILDIWMKYGLVMSSQEILSLLGSEWS